MRFDPAILRRRGIAVRIHASLPAMIPIAVLTAPRGGDWTILFVGMLLGIVIHTGGRLLGWQRIGLRAHDMVLLPTGALVRPERCRLRLGEEWSSALGGGLASALAWLVWTTLARIAIRDGAAEWGTHLFEWARYSGALVLANLSPGFPFDGHRPWRAAVAPWFGEGTAARFGAGAGRITAFMLLIAGLWHRAPWLLYWALFAWGCAEAERRAGMQAITPIGSVGVRPDEIVVSPPPYERSVRTPTGRRVICAWNAFFDDLCRGSTGS